MDYQRHKQREALTIEQQEGYIVCLRDRFDSLNLACLLKENRLLKERIEKKKTWLNKYAVPMMFATVMILIVMGFIVLLDWIVGLDLSYLG